MSMGAVGLLVAWGSLLVAIATDLASSHPSTASYLVGSALSGAAIAHLAADLVTRRLDR